MTDTRNDDRSTAPPTASLTGDVARLVRMAGPRPKMSAESVRRMQGELRPLWEAESRPARRPALRALAAAAVVVLAVTAVLLTRGVLDESGSRFATVARVDGTVTSWTDGAAHRAEPLIRDSALDTGRSVATATSARVALSTLSGHSLRLDHDTRIVLESEQEVRLEQGAVYIDSGAGGRAGEALTVLTPFGAVAEIGTQFEVRLASDTLTVRVREGEVEVGPAEQRQRALAGEELRISSDGVRRSRLEPHDGVFDWTQSIAPAWAMDGSRLEDFLTWAAREAGLALEFADPAIVDESGQVLLKGEVEGLSPREALDVVLPAVGLRHRINTGTLSISRSADRETPRS